MTRASTGTSQVRYYLHIKISAVTVSPPLHVLYLLGSYSVGQNIAYGYRSWGSVLKAWQTEVKDFIYGQLSCTLWKLDSFHSQLATMWYVRVVYVTPLIAPTKIGPLWNTRVVFSIQLDGSSSHIESLWPMITRQDWREDSSYFLTRLVTLVEE